MGKRMRALRGAVDGSDTFVTGHRVIKAREYEKAIPGWAHNDGVYFVNGPEDVRGALASIG